MRSLLVVGDAAAEWVAVDQVFDRLEDGDLKPVREVDLLFEALLDGHPVVPRDVDLAGDPLLLADAPPAQCRYYLGREFNFVGVDFVEVLNARRGGTVVLLQALHRVGRLLAQVCGYEICVTDAW